MSTLFEQIGGRPAVLAAVDNFYERVLADERINQFFITTDMDRQRGKMINFLTVALGGPENYAGKDMRTAHKPLVEKGLNDAHFDAVAEDLVATLQDLSVPQNLIDQVVELVGSLRDEVLNR